MGIHGWAGVRWIAWGFRVVNGEKEGYVVGELECESHILAALVNARRQYGHMFVDHVQSRVSYEIELRETRARLAFNRHHQRRKPNPKVA